MEEARLSIKEAQTIVDALKRVPTKEVYELCGRLRDQGIKRHSITRADYERYYLALSPYAYMDSKTAEAGFENLTIKGVVLTPDKV